MSFSVTTQYSRIQIESDSFFPLHIICSVGLTYVWGLAMRCVKRNLRSFYDNCIQNWGSFSYVLFSFLVASSLLQLLRQTFRYTAAIDFHKVWASEKSCKLRYEEIMKKHEKYQNFIFSEFSIFFHISSCSLMFEVIICQTQFTLHVCMKFWIASSMFNLWSKSEALRVLPRGNEVDGLPRGSS